MIGRAALGQGPTTAKKAPLRSTTCGAWFGYGGPRHKGRAQDAVRRTKEA